jgi:hypothetical protein
MKSSINNYGIEIAEKVALGVGKDHYLVAHILPIAWCNSFFQ